MFITSIATQLLKCTPILDYLVLLTSKANLSSGMTPLVARRADDAELLVRLEAAQRYNALESQNYYID